MLHISMLSYCHLILFLLFNISDKSSFQHVGALADVCGSVGEYRMPHLHFFIDYFKIPFQISIDSIFIYSCVCSFASCCFYTLITLLSAAVIPESHHQVAVPLLNHSFKHSSNHTLCFRMISLIIFLLFFERQLFNFPWEEFSRHKCLSFDL